MILPTKNKLAIQEWVNGKNSPLDEQSKLRAYELFDSDIIGDIEVGIVMKRLSKVIYTLILFIKAK